MSLSSKIRVAVLRGGPSNLYDTSLKTGEFVLSALREMTDTYEPLDIFISKGGEWHKSGLVYKPHRALEHADVVWNTLHGSYGEDGQVQKLLEGMKIPFTGPRTMASTLAMNKDMSKRLYKERSMFTPAYELVTMEGVNDDKLIAIFRSFLQPVVVKPANQSGSIGMSISYTFDGLKESVEKAFAYSPRVLVEEFIKGDEISCGVIEGVKGENIYALTPYSSEPESEFGEVKNMIADRAKEAHEVLGLSHYSSSDFIITPKKKIYILETNSLPPLHEGSLMHRSLGADGWRHNDFVDHVLRLAL
ncbi:MAG: hypothetical protein CO183_00380 [Candidatus Zambryskibacteria bacterium CG_4_9_14_3_um_filter_42_9]|nr:MAG: hypothetical protein CO183_00380 [Candidatus Zambryskibacteria bacterium CG_4_9_14_3_um_filter_42_9]